MSISDWNFLGRRSPIPISTYPGATAIQVEDKILKPIENGLDGVDDVEEYETIANNSFAVGIVTLNAKADIDKSISDINAAMDAVKLPEEAGKVDVSKISTLVISTPASDIIKQVI